MKQRLGSCLAAVMLLSALTSLLPGARAAGEGKVVFESGAPDAGGCFQVTMTMYDATFRVFQFALRYDPAVLQPADQNGGAAESFGDFAQKLPGWLSTVGTELNPQTGLIDFSGYLAPGATGNGVNADTEAVAGAEGMRLFTFRFKRLKEGDAGLQVATQAKGEPYRPACPQGVIVANHDGDVPVSVVFREAEKPDAERIESFPGGADTSAGQNPAPGQTAQPGQSPAPAQSPRPSENPERPAEELLREAVFLRIGSHTALCSAAVSAIYPGERSVTAYARDGRTFVPVRFVAEKLGADVAWENDTRTVVIRRDGHTIRMTVGAHSFTVDGAEQPMDVPAEFLPSSDGNSRTMVPVRFVSQALEYQVEWDQARMLVVIAPPALGWNPAGTAEDEAMDKAAALLAAYSMFV